METKKKCKYHPNRDYRTTCEDCGSPICEECIKSFRENDTMVGVIGPGVGHEDTFMIPFEKWILCPPCYYDRKMENKLKTRLIALPILSFLLGLLSVFLIFVVFPYTPPSGTSPLEFAGGEPLLYLPNELVYLIFIIIIVLAIILFALGLVSELYKLLIGDSKRIKNAKKAKEEFLTNR